MKNFSDFLTDSLEDETLAKDALLLLNLLFEEELFPFRADFNKKGSRNENSRVACHESVTNNLKNLN